MPMPCNRLSAIRVGKEMEFRRIDQRYLRPGYSLSSHNEEGWACFSHRDLWWRGRCKIHTSSSFGSHRDLSSRRELVNGVTVPSVEFSFLIPMRM